MCLYINFNQQKQVAHKNIVCYKILQKVGDKYITPYRGMSIILGETYNSPLIVEELLLKYLDASVVNIGLHSFVKKTDACISLISIHEARLIKCVIPKGSSYYTNINGTEYASDKITYGKTIIKL
jgi:hypothetical protein